MNLKPWLYEFFIKPFTKPTPIGFTEEVFSTFQRYANGIHPNEFVCFLEYEEFQGSDIIRTTNPRRDIDVNQTYAIITDMYLTSTQATPTSASAETTHLPSQSIIGTLHTHPSGNTRPSDTDKSMFQKYPINIIFGHPYTRSTMSIYTADSTLYNGELSFVTVQNHTTTES